MLRNVRLMQLMGIRPVSVVHIGGHLGQDHTEYLRLGAKKVIWGEADLSNAREIVKRYPDANVVNGLFWSKYGERIEFNIMKDRAQNSIHAARVREDIEHTQPMVSTTLDFEFGSLELAEPIMLTLDVQGSELRVLRGGEKFLERVKFLVCEITEASPISQFTISEEEIFECVRKYGFKKSITRYSHTKEYYDALYVKGSRLFNLKIKLIDSLRKLAMPLRAIRINSNQ